MVEKKYFKGIAKDYEHGYPYPYPKSEEEKKKVRLPYDFIFTRGGEWFYISSSHNWRQFTQKKYALHEPVEAKGEQWKVVSAVTGEIMNESKKTAG